MAEQRFLEELRDEFPKFRLVRKQNSRLMRVLATVLRVVTFGAQAHFMDRYVTTVGQTVFVPIGWDDWDSHERVSVLRHERVHMRQARRYTFPLFMLLYLLLPLPVGLAYFRARFEWEAYKETIRAIYEQGGLVAVTRAKPWIVMQFTSGAYGWMWPFPRVVVRWYDEAVGELLEGT